MLKEFIVITLLGTSVVLNGDVLNETQLLQQAQKTVKSIDTERFILSNSQ